MLRPAPGRTAMRRRPARPRWLWILLALDALAAGVGLYLLRPQEVCTGDPPSCVDLHPYWGLLRFVVILVAAVAASVLFAVARVEEARREEEGGPPEPRGRT